MNKFRNLSIRTKLLSIVIITVIIALLIALAAIATLSHKLASKEFDQQLNVLVDITAERSLAALAFKDKRTVTKNIETLSKLSSIDLACIYNLDNQLFSQYERTENSVCPETLKQTKNRINKASFYVNKPLLVKKRNIGALYVEANAEEVNQRLINFIVYAGFIIVCTIILTYQIAYRLQFSLTVPIIKLSNVAKEISKTQDLSLRAKIYNDDEAGYLAKSFNGLMHDIHESQIKTGELVLELQEKTQQLETHSDVVEQRNKSIKNMFAGASHDLKQPLQAMVLFVNALNSMSDPTQKALLGKLELAINNMKALFENLLDVSKLESLLDKVDLQTVALKPILDNVFNEFEVLAQDKSLTLRFRANDFNVTTNGAMLERIIRNLLSNAIRYTNEGGVLLACRERNGLVSIEIWDTGIGIDEDSIDSIFERFHQVKKEDEAGHQGHGLGLSIVKRLTERLSHTIEVQSNYGRGTLFRIEIPFAEQRTNLIEEKAKSTDMSAIEVASPVLLQAVQLPTNNINILLIDDDELILDSLQTLIQSWGMNVIAFNSITVMQQYLSENTTHHCDVIISDFHLSAHETGLDAITAARNLLEKQIPALIVSATEEESDIEKIKASKIPLLNKPVKAAKLRALVNHVYNSSTN